MPPTAKHYRQGLIALAGAMMAQPLALADSNSPPAEFWYYMAEFADDKAAVFDPADYALMTNLPDKPTDATAQQQIPQTTPQTTPQPAATHSGQAVEKIP